MEPAGNPKVKVQKHVDCGKDDLIAEEAYASDAIKIIDSQLCHFQDSIMGKIYLER